MEALTNNKMWATDVDAFRREVNRIAEDVFDDAFEEAMKNFKLFGLVPFTSISQDLASFRYTPELPDYLMADDAEDYTCDDDDSPVYMAEGHPYTGQTRNLTKRYELCMHVCKNKDLREEVKRKLIGVLRTILLKMYRSFWTGSPSHSQWGILNHPATKYLDSSIVWSAATDNAIAMQIVDAAQYMTNAKVAVARNIYNQSIGLSKEGNSGSCSMRAACIAAIINAQDGIDFDGEIRSSEDLNANKDHGDLVIIYDADGLEMTKADPILIASTPQGTSKVTGRVNMNTAGLHLRFHNSIKIIIGAGAGAK